MLKIGLTGGIASGKSTIVQLFSQIGVPVIDADVIAHDLVQSGKPALLEIAYTFGQKILQKDGQLDRHYLRHIIFSDNTAKQKLEQILHPKIRQELEHRTQSINSAYCILCIPLLIEANMVDLVDRVLVVDINKAEQIKRLQQRDNSSETEIKAIIASQCSAESRLAIADDIINNDGEQKKLKNLVQTLHNNYLKLAQMDTTS